MFFLIPIDHIKTEEDFQDEQNAEVPMVEVKNESVEVIESDNGNESNSFLASIDLSQTVRIVLEDIGQFELLKKKKKPAMPLPESESESESEPGPERGLELEPVLASDLIADLMSPVEVSSSDEEEIIYEISSDYDSDL